MNHKSSNTSGWSRNAALIKSCYRANVEDEEDATGQASRGSRNSQRNNKAYDWSLPKANPFGGAETFALPKVGNMGAAVMKIARGTVKTKAALAATKDKIDQLGGKVRDVMGDAVAAIKDLDIPAMAKKAKKWVREHPKETIIIVACILIPTICMALTPVIMGGLGFTATGIVAGSVAAGIQAGIGNVVAGSLFAILTSAAMGGFGAPIVIGSVWGLSSLVCWGFAAFCKFWGQSGHDAKVEGSGVKED